MARTGGVAGRVVAVAAVVGVGAGALTGCRAGADAAGGAPIRITKTSLAPADPAPAARAEPAGKAPRPAHTEPAADTPKRRAPADPVVMGYGTRSGQVRELQARLRQSGHFHRGPTGFYGPVTTASVRAFQGGQGLARTGTVTRRTWSALLARTHEPTHDELYPPTSRPLDTPDPRCMTGRALCISKKSRTLAWIVDGTVRSAMDVRFGSAYTPTREGLFKVDFKSRHHVSTIYHTPMPYAMFFSGGQAVHYSSDFAARGYAGASHGCVNVRDEKKIAALFAQVRPGDKVVVYK